MILAILTNLIFCYEYMQFVDGFLHVYIAYAWFTLHV